MDPGALRQFVDKVFSSYQSTQIPDILPSNPSQSSTRPCVDRQPQMTISAKEMENLDIKESCTATLVCYLELQGWLEITNSIYDICTLKWDGGSDQLKSLERVFPVVAAATAKLRGKGIGTGYIQGYYDYKTNMYCKLESHKLHSFLSSNFIGY